MIENSDTKKVLIIDGQLYFGGGETFKLDIVRALGNEKYKFTFSTPENGEFWERIKELRYDLIPFTPRSRLDIIRMVRFAKKLANERYDIIITTDSISWYTGVILKIFIRPKLLLAVIHIATLGLGQSFNIWKRIIIRFVDLLWTAFYDFIVHSTEFHANLMRKEGINQKKLVIIHNSVDRHFIISKISQNLKDHWRKQLNIPSGYLILSMFGRFGPGKDFQNLLHAIPLVLRQYDKCVFILTGDGPDLEKMKGLSEKLGIEKHIRFTGFVREGYYELLSIIDIFINSTISEGISYVVLDVMAMGKPIVATRAGGIEGAVRDNINGLLVPMQHPQALADAILVMINKPELRKRFGEASLQIQETEFSFERMKKDITKLITNNIGWRQ